MAFTNAAHVRTRRDEQLVYSAQRGSSDAFDELQRFYWRRLYNTVFRITGSREDAEDALQDTFLRAYASICKFEGRSTIYSWLTRIAVNSALTILRKRRAHPEILFDPGASADDGGPHFDVMDSSPNPEQIVDYRQRRTQLMRAIQGLQPKLRNPIQLLIAQECSLKEVSGALEMPHATAKARLYRARHRLTESVTRDTTGKPAITAKSRRYIREIPKSMQREDACRSDQNPSRGSGQPGNGDAAS